MTKYDNGLIVVTGGAGFIGSGVIRELNNRGLSNLVVVDDLKDTEKWKNLVGKQFLDIISKNDLFEWLEGRESEVKAFIHMGACSSTVERDAGYLLENNYRYTLRLAEYALSNQQRFIYASSAATYGDGSLGFSDDHSLLETLQPLNMYGYSKHLFDLWAKRQGVLGQVVGLKFFNIFGPNEHHKGRMSSVIPKFLDSVRSKGEIGLFKSSDPAKYADGGQMRDFLYVKDAARMVCDLLESDASGIYNIGSGQATTWNVVAKAVIDAMKVSAKINYIDMPVDLQGKYQNYSRAVMNKIHSLQDVDGTATPIEESVREHVQEYLMRGRLW
ncbi:MAG: ADP-glyceromanno-heptose 6-epimerase [Chlamydiota bacterium]